MKLSFVIITNGNRPAVTNISIKSVIENIKNTHHNLFVIGDVEKFNGKYNTVNFVDRKEWAHGGHVSKLRNLGVEISDGDFIINMDDDIVLPLDFLNKLISGDAISQYDSFNTRIYLPSGGRYWDRVSINNGINSLKDYSYIGDDLYYCSTFLIRKRKIATDVPYDENHLYYDKTGVPEDVKHGIDLKKKGYNVNIDVDNYVFHLDDTYVSGIDGSGLYVVVKNKNRNLIKAIKDLDKQKELNNLIKRLR